MFLEHRKKNEAFTLVEIMLVVIIIGVLAAMVAPKLTGRGEQAKVSAAKADIDANITAALDLYEMDTGGYPTTAQGLAALVAKPTAPPVSAQWSGPYLKKKKIPVDPWGREYIYQAPGAHNSDSFDLLSLGRDGVEGNDDIVNW